MLKRDAAYALDELIDDVIKNKASSLIIRPYDPEGAWLWSQWSGSLLQLTRWKVLGLALLAGIIRIAAAAAPP